MLTALFLSLALSFAPSTDTITFYSIDQVVSKTFDGNRLVGKTVESYQVDTVRDENNVFYFHIIKSRQEQGEEGMKASTTARPVFIIDGKVVDENQFHSLDAKTIRCVNVYKSSAASEMARKYGVDGSGGLIIIITKSFKGKD